MTKTKLSDNQIASIEYNLFTAELQKTMFRRNVIINGNFDVWQRGTSFAAVTGGDYTADRWQYGQNGAVVHTVARSTDVPTYAQSGVKSNYSIKADVTTADASLAADDFSVIRYKTEGYDYARIAGGDATVSFWVKSPKTGTHCLTVKNSAADRSYTREYTVSVANTWEKKTITFPLTETGGTWDYTNGTGLVLEWCLGAGTTYQGTADQWNSANTFATSNQVNTMDNIANDFLLAQVQLEAGDVATPFEFRHHVEEMTLCYRYFQKSCEYAIAPYAAATLGRERFKLPYNVADTANFNRSFTYPNGRMRAAATVIVYSTTTGTTGNVRDDITAADEPVSILNASETSYEITNQAGHTLNSGDNLNWQMTAAAEL